MSGKILIVDGHNIFMRYFYAIEANDPLNIGNSVILFLNSLSREIYSRGITQVYVVFDGGARLHKQYDSNYKMDRGKAPSFRHSIEQKPFFETIFTLKQILKQIIKQIIIKYEEGDMVMSYLIDKFKKDNLVYLMSNDNDFFQLLDDNVFIIKKGGYILSYSNYTTLIPSLLYIKPKSYPLWKSIMGDTCDNVTGVFGIGEKALEKIFFEFFKANKNVVTPEDLKNNLSLLPEKLYTKLSKSMDIIVHNYKLVSLSMFTGLLSHWGKLEIEYSLSAPFLFNNKEALKLVEPYKKYMNVQDPSLYFSAFSRLKYNI